MSKDKQCNREFVISPSRNPTTPCHLPMKTLKNDHKLSIQNLARQNPSNLNHIGDVATSVIQSKDMDKPKYKTFYHHLFKCLCFLEKENRKLLEAIQNRIRITDEAKQLDEFLDDFAFRVASKKDDYERSLIGQATSEGQQAFMAKRWKIRYHNLLDLGLEYEKILKQVVSTKSGDIPDKTTNTTTNHGVSSNSGSQSSDSSNKDIGRTINLTDIHDNQTKKILEFFDEALNLPWESDTDINLKTKQSIPDISYNWNHFPETRIGSSYEYGDFTIPISSVFIQDLLANHKSCAEDIKSQNELKCRLFHVLKKTKNQRNQLKRCVIDQEAQIQLLNKTVQETEMLLVRNSKTKSKPDEIEPSPSPNGDTDRNTDDWENRIQDQLSQSSQIRQDFEQELIKERELAEQKEIDDLISQCQMLEYRKRELEGVLAEEEQQRKILSKKLQDLVGTIHVSCRIKPHPDNYLKIVSDDKLLLPKSLEPLKNCTNPNRDNNQMRCFIFEKVLGPDTNHYEIFKKLGQPLGSCLDGRNLCIMTYGPRKSGKFFTMFGDIGGQKSNDLTANLSGGIAQDTVHLLLSMARQRTTWHYEIHLRALSITNDGIRDLLKDNKSSFIRTIKTMVPDGDDDDNDDGFPPTKQVELSVGSDFDSVVQYIHDTELKRSIQSHHMIMKITIEGTHRALKENTKSVLILAKLASWEKKSNIDESELLVPQMTPNSESKSTNDSLALQQKQQEQIQQQQQMTTTSRSLYGVNQSLLALSRVFSALRRRKTPNYNESLLTQILRPVLTGQSKCFLIVTINSDPNEFTSTLASLQFGQNAMQAPTRLLADSRSRLCSPNQRDSPTA